MLLLIHGIILGLVLDTNYDQDLLVVRKDISHPVHNNNNNNSSNDDDQKIMI